jgi:hypothetical protein
MKKAIRICLVLVSAIVIGYYFRGAFGREATYWLIAVLGGLAVVLKLLQFGLQHYVKAQEAKMSPEERQEFEQFKEKHR